MRNIVGTALNRKDFIEATRLAARKFIGSDNLVDIEALDIINTIKNECKYNEFFYKCKCTNTKYAPKDYVYKRIYRAELNIKYMPNVMVYAWNKMNDKWLCNVILVNKAEKPEDNGLNINLKEFDQKRITEDLRYKGYKERNLQIFIGNTSIEIELTESYTQRFEYVIKDYSGFFNFFNVKTEEEKKVIMDGCKFSKTHDW